MIPNRIRKIKISKILVTTMTITSKEDANMQLNKNLTTTDLINKYSSHIICLIIVTLSFTLMMYYGDRRSLWLDDLSTIAFVGPGQSLREVIDNIMYDALAVPPLFYIIAFFWIRIAPYGTLWLLIPSIIFTVIGMYMCGIIARKLKGNRAAVLATIIASASTFQILHGAYTFRMYGLLFLMSVLCIYFYVLRLENPEKVTRYVLLYGIASALIMYTNYFGILVVAALGLCDLVLLAVKKLKMRHMLAYVLAGALFLPFFIPVLLRQMERQFGSWVPRPYTDAMSQLFTTMTSYSSIVGFLFAVGAVGGLILLFSTKLREALFLNRKQLFSTLTQAFTLIFVIGTAYYYSRYINPEGSVFWPRYFISTLPQLLIVAALGAEYILTALLRGWPKIISRITSSAVAAALAITLGISTFQAVQHHANTYLQPFREAANWIVEQEDAYEPDTLVVTRAFARGFSYYITQNGQRPHIEVILAWTPHQLNTFIQQNHADWRTIYRFDGHPRLDCGELYVLNTRYELTEEIWKWGSVIYVYRRIDN